MFAGLFIMITVLSINFLGDALRDLLGRSSSIESDQMAPLPERFPRSRSERVPISEMIVCEAQALGKIVCSGVEHFRCFFFVSIHSV